MVDLASYSWWANLEVFYCEKLYLVSIDGKEETRCVVLTAKGVHIQIVLHSQRSVQFPNVTYHSTSLTLYEQSKKKLDSFIAAVETFLLTKIIRSNPDANKST